MPGERAANKLMLDTGFGLDLTLRHVMDANSVKSALLISTAAAYINGDLTVTGDVDMASFLNQIFYTAMDGQDTATADSLAYRIAEIERHLHHSEQWYGKDAGDAFLNRNSLTAWQITAGTSEAYGTEVQLSNGDEVESGSTTKKYDLHEIQIVDVSNANALYKIEFWYGTGAFGAATLLTEMTWIADNVNFSSGPIAFGSRRIACNNKLWARCKCQTNSATIDFLVGLHVYDG